MRRYANRNIILKKYNLDGCSIIDYGCGDKDILNFIKPFRYVGVDKNPNADIVIDFDKEKVKIQDQFDVAIMLGLLEWLERPFDFLNQIKTTADRFIILSFIRENKKKNWKQHFTENGLEKSLGKIFQHVDLETHGKWTIFDCKGLL